MKADNLSQQYSIRWFILMRQRRPLYFDRQPLTGGFAIWRDRIWVDRHNIFKLLNMGWATLTRTVATSQSPGTLYAIMESYKIDRTYTWLMSAIGHSKDIVKRYFYDPERKLFFNIGCTNGIYHLCTYKTTLSDFDSEFILSQIVHLREKTTNLIEIPKSNRKYHLFKTEAKETEEEFQNRENDWKRLFEEAEVFLRRNNIKISETRLIE